MSVASTAIDEKGIAKDLSLRKIETTIPCNVYGTILNVANEDVELLLETFKWVKRLGLGRNRGYGRCGGLEIWRRYNLNVSCFRILF